MTRRPEGVAPPEIFYNDDEARKYTQNSRIMEIQEEMTNRCIELLEIDDEDGETRLVLDIGCGSGLSGECLDERDAALEREVGGDLVLADMGERASIRAGTFDNAISVSALQWLCNKDKAAHNPIQRLSRFFTSLYAVLNTGGRAVFQFYPADEHQKSLIMAQATRAGFNGGVLIDFPESKKKMKLYLVLTVGSTVSLPEALTEAPVATVSYAKRQTNHQRNKNDLKTRTAPKFSREWILEKKERRRRQGKDVRPDTKYTARKRSDRF
ncbi:putative 18S rRNA (guanine-N(7))-methyltransferase [Orchesella cincta]|uniref:Putative 18S rRNA (Guanine-N(7))-methyltransferase n=1 Tax=Orchesella cincta TaxID=48709 RepID=A0A1D2M9Y0_ORCCI|nr:putative 18S rRNA (guanine-N(7))-methyltransferase [Orchesella cincta]